MQVRKDWTVLVYQGGVNNLDANLKQNLRELVDAPNPDNVNVVVRQLDALGEQRDYVVSAAGLTPLGEASEVNSASPATLAGFLELGMSQYPAQHYVLVVSSHGQGAAGVIEDERHGTLMQLPELRSALQAGREANGGVPLDLVFFDACRMMAVETASELAGEAQVVVGSLDRIGSQGYDPAAFLHSVAASSGAVELAERLVEDPGERQYEVFGTLSAVDLARIRPLEEAFCELTQAIAELDTASAARVRVLAAQARRSLPSPSYQEGLANMALHMESEEERREFAELTKPADPVAIMSLCQALREIPQLAPAAERVARAHEEAVLWRRDGETDSLTVSWPLDPPAHPPSGLRFEQMTGWIALTWRPSTQA